MYPEQRGPTQETTPPTNGGLSTQTPSELADARQRAEALASNATRHLCAASYIDDEYRDLCLREVLYQPRRIVAPSYGFDLVTVLGHAQRARNIATYRDAAILGLAAVTACVSASSLLVAVISLIWLYAALAGYRLLRTAFQQVRAGKFAFGTLMVRVFANALGIGASILLLFLAYGLYAALNAGALASAAFGDSGSLLVTSFGGILLFFVFLCLPVGARVWRQLAVDALGPGNQPARPRMTPRLQEIEKQLGGNTVIYSGEHPFVGSGVPFRSEGFALRLVKAPDNALSALGRTTEAAREFPEPPFSAVQLVEHLRAELEPLRRERYPERALSGLIVEDRIFLSGTEATRLVPVTSDDMVAHVIRHPVSPARHYLACSVVSWRGELAATVYVHVAVQGRSLYVELTSTVLAPCLEKYRVVDRVEGHGLPAYVRAVREGLAEAPLIIGAVPVSLIRAGIAAVVSAVTKPVQALLPRGYDYGARISVREEGMEQEIRDHLQGGEILKYSRVVERRIFAAILDFLEAKGVDVAEYRARAGDVLNIGAVNNGPGTVNMGPTVAGGQQTNNAAPPAQVPATTSGSVK